MFILFISVELHLFNLTVNLINLLRINLQLKIYLFVYELLVNSYIIYY